MERDVKEAHELPPKHQVLLRLSPSYCISAHWDVRFPKAIAVADGEWKAHKWLGSSFRAANKHEHRLHTRAHTSPFSKGHISSVTSREHFYGHAPIDDAINMTFH